MTARRAWRWVLVAAAATVAGLGLAGTALAQGAAPLVGLCFTRTYDAAHLRRHPAQQVTAMRVDFVEWEDGFVARVRLATRQGGLACLHRRLRDANRRRLQLRAVRRRQLRSDRRDL